MKLILEHTFDFVTENRYSIVSTYLEPITITNKHKIEFDVANKIPLEIEITFSDDQKNYFRIRSLRSVIEIISNAESVVATKMVLRTDIKAVVTIKVSK